MKTIREEFISFVGNTLIQLFKKYPDAQWDYSALSDNLNISIDVVLNHLDKKWKFIKISRHPKITIIDVAKHPKLSWDWAGVCSQISLAFIEEMPDIKWNLFGLSQNPELTLDFIKKSK